MLNFSIEVISAALENTIIYLVYFSNIVSNDQLELLYTKTYFSINELVNNALSDIYLMALSNHERFSYYLLRTKIFKK